MKFKKMSKKRTVYLTAFLVFVGVLVWAFLSAAVITHNFHRSQLAGNADEQALNTSDIILTESQGGKRYWELYAQNGSYSSDSRMAILTNATGNFYDKSNNVSMSFISSKGTYDSEKKQIILYNRTHIVIKDGTSLYCDRLVWSGSDKPIIATGHIKIKRGKQLLSTAKKATISADYSRFKISGGTSTKLYDTKEKK
ncbi:LPS export ABC transporter periplasmic protein LptC [bacterium]|nr:LPS export ABC transporter periplasmic protein LptC [bacterium]